VTLVVWTQSLLRAKHRFSDCPRARGATEGATRAANSLVIAEPPARQQLRRIVSVAELQRKVESNKALRSKGRNSLPDFALSLFSRFLTS
jgi:hypothetical protein